MVLEELKSTKNDFLSFLIAIRIYSELLMTRSLVFRSLVISPPLIKQDLYLSGDDIKFRKIRKFRLFSFLNFCKVKKLNKSIFFLLCESFLTFVKFVGIRKDVIGNLQIKQMIHLNGDDIT